MTRLVFAATIAAAVLGTACEKSKGTSEEAPIQKGSTPKPLPPPPPKADEAPPKTDSPPVPDSHGGHAAHDPAMPPAPAPPGSTAPTPAAPPVVGSALPMDTVRPPDAADLAVYLKGIPGKGTLRTVIDTSLGSFHCELFEKDAPMTVANWVGLATGKKPWTDPNTNTTMTNKPFFNGIIFHRVIPGFMVQAGDPLGKGIGGPGYNFDDEVGSGRKMDAGGILAMANAGPGTNGSQFFITEAGADWLTGKHTIFGKCDEVALVTKITGVERDGGDRPKTPVVIKKVSILRK